MTTQQKTVMWMGILLIVVRFFTGSQFRIIWAEIISGNNPGRIGVKASPSIQNQIHNSRGAGAVLGGAISSGSGAQSGTLAA